MVTDRLIKRMQELHAPIVVGLDPQLEQIPNFIKNENFGRFGETQKGVAEIFLEFNKAIINQICEIVPAVKPQIAFYEKYGIHGIDCY
ncbi:MAG: orotidine 5'-phosphate decarboxylase, partial [Clostridiales bacterium]|nr:orotidine 5'-phosphate decarboxylase [Clostridiales bacterium]